MAVVTLIVGSSEHQRSKKGDPVLVCHEEASTNQDGCLGNAHGKQPSCWYVCRGLEVL